MAIRWFTLLIGVTLIQGLLALSPIPLSGINDIVDAPDAAEEEWSDFYRMLRDVRYRLPTTTLPSHYEVNLTPVFDTPPLNVDEFTFDGSVVIYLSATEENVNEIVMHCNDLTIQTLTVEYEVDGEVHQIVDPENTFTCEMPYSFLRIPTTEALVMDQEYVARITFRGILQTNMRGFYRSWYTDSTGARRWMGTTQFQPHHARQAFPCYDEPGFKATFDITINREESFSPTISNMPLISSTPVTTVFGPRIADSFHRTPQTSTYLLAFIVSHYVIVSENNDDDRPFAIYARDNIGSNGDWSLEVGEALLEAMDEYTDFPYYTMAPNMNMKQAAIPDFSAGAMENWGLLTYREALILYDPQNSNHFYRQRVANIVSHEIAHMWFGNLVTCSWWDNLWLNEGFARFYQYYLTGQVRPELGFSTRFIVEQVHTAMFSDSIDSAHALTDPTVNDPASVSAFFSTISYAKGAAVLRMTQHLLDVPTYVKGLQNYLKDRAYQVAEPHHLFQALDNAAAEDNALADYEDLTIDTYFRTWSEQGGHPLLNVAVDQRTGEITVTQARWERNNGVSTIASTWIVPLTWTRGGDVDFENLKPSFILRTNTATIDRGTTGLEWVVFNKQQSGFYRVNYDDTNWALVTRALRGSERTVIHEYNRAQIVDDVFALARASVMPYHRALNILSFLEFEDQYGPWLAAISGFNFLLRRLAHDQDNLDKLKAEIIHLSTAVTARLGYAEVQGESYMDGLLRMYLMEFLCNVGHEQCVAAGIASFQSWRNADTHIPANMRPWVYCVGLREGDAEDFDFFWSRYLNEDLANEIVVMLQTAGCTSDQASLNTFLDAIVEGEFIVRPQDHSTALNSAVSGNEFNTGRMFEWLQNNIEQTTATLGSVSSPLNLIAGRLLNEEDIVEFEEWLEANIEVIGTASYNTGRNGAQNARNNLVWSANRMDELAQYFETGYVEDEIEEIESDEGIGGDTEEDDETTEETEEDEDSDADSGEDEVVETDEDEGNETDEEDENDTEEEEDEGSPSDEDDSANIAAFSVMTLVVTLAINFAV